MINFVKGDIFTMPVIAIVNPVNCMGVMGRGLALEFKQRFPDNFKIYREACLRKEVRVGQMHVVQMGDTDPSPLRWIINFPTKSHWKDPSRIEWVEQGLKELRHTICRHQLSSIAIPAIGTGLGQLQWPIVKKLIETSLSDLPSTEVFVIPPLG